MFIASFIAGSVFPFSSETLFVLLLLTDADPLTLFVAATVGNVAGSMFNYGVGRLGNPAWRDRLMPKDPVKRARQEGYIQRWGAWAGLLTCVPILGSCISVMLGYMRISPWLSLLSIFISKAGRYAILAYIVLVAKGY